MTHLKSSEDPKVSEDATFAGLDSVGASRCFY